MFLTDTPTILVLDPASMPSGEGLALLHDAGLKPTLIGPGPASEGDLARVDIIVTRTGAVDKSLIGSVRQCLLILIQGPAGPNVGVSLDAARRAGIYVASIPDFASDAWAEFSIQGIAKAWSKLCGQDDMHPSEVFKGRRVGLVGLGQVGLRVAKLASGFNARVWACDPFAPAERFVDHGIASAPLHELAGIAQILTLHLPLVEPTRGLIGKDVFRNMQRHSVLVNIAAPDLIDWNELAVSLESERPEIALFGADLNRFLAPGHPLRAHPRVLHGTIPQDADSALQDIARRRAAELMIAFLKGNRPPHLLIDPPCPRHVLLLAGERW